MAHDGQPSAAIGAVDVVRCLPGVYFVVDPGLVVTAASDDAISQLAVGLDDVVGHRLFALPSPRWSLVGSQAERSVFDAVEQAMASGEQQVHESVASTGGSERSIRWAVSPLVSDAGQVEGAILHAQGVGRARREEERFRLLSSATSDALWDWNLDTDALWWSEGIHTLFGHRPEELDPTIASWTSLIHPDDADWVLAEVRAAIEGADSWRGEYRFVRSDGEVVWVEDRARVVRDENGRPRRMVGGMSDITEQRRVEDRAHREQRLESIGVLAGGVAHNLNNILAPILLAAEAVADDVAGTPSESSVELIVESATRAADLCRELLTFARGVQGRRERIVAADLLDGVVRLVGETFPKHIQLVTVGTSTLPILGDATQLQQVLLNVCVNARDAMPDGGTLTIEVDDIATSDLPDHPLGGRGDDDVVSRHERFVRFSITDTGCGMDESTLEHLWDPFFTTKDLGRGTGLGLPTSLAILTSHGGVVDVESDPGVGSRFTIHVPVAHVDGVAEPDSHRRDVVDGGGSVVLVVDDEEAIRRTASTVLDRAGFVAAAAPDGRTALEMLSGGERIDVVVTDVMMSGMGGLHLVAALHQVVPDLPVVLMSGAGDGPPPEWQDVAYVSKPFAAHELFAAIDQAMGPR